MTCLDAPAEVIKLHINFSVNLFYVIYTCVFSVVYGNDGLILLSIQAVVEHKEVKRADQLNKSYASEIELFRSLAGGSDADCLEHLINQITSGNDKDSISPIVLSANSDKCHRTVSL